MKKLTTLVFAFFLTAGIAFSQNTADITSNGNNNSAEINQATDDGSMAQIESVINQVGNDNDAVTNISRRNDRNAETSQLQEGNGNTAYINKDAFGDYNAGVLIEQVQIGNANEARSSGGDNYSSYQEQRGRANTAMTSDNGKNADIWQYQEGNNNYAQVGGLEFASSMQEQLGDDNISDLQNVGHDGPGEDYNTYQEGNGNMVELLGGGFGGTLDVDQVGNANTANISWGSALNTATVEHIGNSNTASITQN